MKLLLLFSITALVATAPGCTPSSGNRTQGAAATPIASQSPLLAKVGEVVSIDDRALKVLSVRSMASIPSGNQFIESPTAKGIFVVLVVEVTNTGKETGNVAFSNFELTDAQGRTYKTSDDFHLFSVVKQFAEGQPSDDIPPGLTNQFPLVFDVTPDASDLLLNWKGRKIDLQSSSQVSEPHTSAPGITQTLPPVPEPRPAVRTAVPEASNPKEQQRPTSVMVDGVKVEIPDKPGFNAYVYDPPSNCRASASKSGRVATVFERGFINVEPGNSVNGWYRESYKDCYIHESQFKLIPSEYLVKK